MRAGEGLPARFVGKGNAMRFAVASDIHGSLTWMRAVERVVEGFSPDRVILLGDLLYHGPRNPLPEGYDPMAVAGILNGMASRIVAVRGNCDAEVDQMVLDFPCMADYALVSDGELSLFCTHGHLFSPDEPPALAQGSVFLHGHFHVKCDEMVLPAGWDAPLRVVNPGSVGYPKDGSHSMLLIEDGAFEFRMLEGESA